MPEYNMSCTERPKNKKMTINNKRYIDVTDEFTSFYTYTAQNIVFREPENKKH